MASDARDLLQLPLPDIWKVQPLAYLRGPYRVEIKKTLPRLEKDFQNIPLAEFGGKFDFAHPYAVPGHDDYMIARAFGTEPDTAHHCLLLHRDTDGRVSAVGGVDHWGLYIDPKGDHRGKGLGGELAYAAAAFSGELNAGYALYSKSGYAAFRKAHELAVCRALEAGLDVDRSIVAQYPRIEQARVPSPR